MHFSQNTLSKNKHLIVEIITTKGYVLVETILWVFRAYRSHGFHTNYWAAQLNSWIEILRNELSEEAYTEIYPYYEWMQVNIPLFVLFSDEKLEAPNSMH
jgi:hypothetical protein